MEGITGLEAAAQELASLGLGCSGINGCPLRWQLCASLKTPIAERLGDILPNLLTSQVLEEPPPDHLADLGLVVGDKLPRDCAHNLQNLLLPLKIPVGHLDLTARQ